LLGNGSVFAAAETVEQFEARDGESLQRACAFVWSMDGSAGAVLFGEERDFVEGTVAIVTATVVLYVLRKNHGPEVWVRF
jgi:hypothetical protein